ncbi:hypothetical protein [uncultured Muribaculum sp.]|uniref:hypothetical protein n=1 Tax=uncultured Muribaculum sp. TaxID=1918613 RepID=UPI00266ED84C|nr:hypothetical protein [uncultured Muribaculum sp.]
MKLKNILLLILCSLSFVCVCSSCDSDNDDDPVYYKRIVISADSNEPICISSFGPQGTNIYIRNNFEKKFESVAGYGYGSFQIWCDDPSTTIRVKVYVNGKKKNDVKGQKYLKVTI